MTAAILKFEAPPRRRDEIHLPGWTQRLRELQKRPGEWAQLYSDMENVPGGNGQFAVAVRAGRIKLLEGIWEFAARRVRDRHTDEWGHGWRLDYAFYGRYLGPADDGGTWLVSGRQGDPPYRIGNDDEYPLVVSATAK